MWSHYTLLGTFLFFSPGYLGHHFTSTLKDLLYHFMAIWHGIGWVYLG